MSSYIRTMQNNCRCASNKCQDSRMPHYGTCAPCYIKGMTPKQRREFWQQVSAVFNDTEQEQNG